MMDFASQWEKGLSYKSFLDKFATPEQRRRWDDIDAQITLSQEQQALIKGFRRDMPVIVVAGAWCGDCIQQCPMLEHFARLSPRLQIRYFDRDAHSDLADELSICGGRRVPSVLFLSEDFQQCGRHGDRTLSKYRDSAGSLEGISCPSGLAPLEQSLQSKVVQDWLNEFERVQLMLRLSPRLRQKHGD